MDAPVKGCLGLAEAERVPDYPAARAAAEDVKVLISVVDRLLRQIHAATDSELGKLRAEAGNALAAAKAAVTADATEMREATGAFNQRAAWQSHLYIRNQPLVALGLSVGCGLAIGLWVARSAARGH